MKGFFFKRAPREKILLLVFALLLLFTWAGQGLGRARALWDDWRHTREELAVQRIWLQNRAAIDVQVLAAAQSLEPSRTLNATRLVAELNALAAQAGLAADIGAQRTERSGQFAFHAVQVTFRGAELPALLKFYRELSQRAPYLGLEQFSLASDRAAAGQLNASFRIGSPELIPPP